MADAILFPVPEMSREILQNQLRRRRKLLVTLFCYVQELPFYGNMITTPSDTFYRVIVVQMCIFLPIYFFVLGPLCCYFAGESAILKPDWRVRDQLTGVGYSQTGH